MLTREIENLRSLTNSLGQNQVTQDSAITSHTFKCVHIEKELS